MPRSTKDEEKWDANDPQRYRYELATMGCRTRVFENVAGEKSSLGRGKPFVHHAEHASPWPSKPVSKQKT